MTVHADDVARAFADTWELLFAGVTDGWCRREGGVVAAVSHPGPDRDSDRTWHVPAGDDSVDAAGRPPPALTAAQDVDALVVRELAPEEAGVHVRIMALGFETPEAIFAQILTPSVLALPGVSCYVGEVGGEPVTTSLGVTVGPSTGVFNVATPPEHRGHGYGTAVTVRAAVDGLPEGAEWAWLQSSAAGYGVYQKLGFRTVESWPCWIKAD